MSGSNWRNFAKDRLGLIVALFIAGIVTLVVVESAWLQQRQLYDETARNSAYYAENAKNDVAINCGVEAPAKCAEEINDATRKEQREEYDLYAQRAVAVWTAVMGGMAVLGVALSAVGVYLIWTTFRETRSTARAAIDANEISNRVAKAELRPYLFVEAIKLTDIRDGTVEEEDQDGLPKKIHGHFYGTVDIHFRNYGKVPARNIRVFKRVFYARFYQGEFSHFRSRTTDLPVCAPGHERRIFDVVTINGEDREEFNFGSYCYVLRLRFWYQDEDGNTFTDCADYKFSGDSLDTFYLLLGPHHIAEQRQRWAEYEPELFGDEEYWEDEENDEESASDA